MEVEPKINYHIIHCKNHLDERTKQERTKNIEHIYDHIFCDNSITIFDAIDGNSFSNIIPLQEIIKSYDPNLFVSYDNHLTNCEIGCYLSHYLIVKNSQQYDVEHSYSVILEDDAQILSADLHSDILDILRDIDIDFDIIFLGNLNHHKGKLYRENIYFLDDTPCWGTHSLLINNKNAEKICQELRHVNIPIDNKYTDLIRSGKLIGLVIWPVLSFPFIGKSTIH